MEGGKKVKLLKQRGKRGGEKTVFLATREKEQKGRFVYIHKEVGKKKGEIRAFFREGGEGVLIITKTKEGDMRKEEWHLIHLSEGKKNYLPSLEGDGRR